MFQGHLQRTRRQILSPGKWKLRIVFWGGALSIGAIAAVFAQISFHADGLFHQFYDQHPLLSLLVPPLGLLLIAWLTRKVFIGTEGSGIPQAIAALSMPTHIARARVLSLKVAAGKILLTIGGLFCGASIGREGPTVHVGASIMYSLRRIAPFHGKDMVRALILAGGAAGISAAFNTPLAGIMFAVEEMSRSFEERTSGTLLISVILAGITALAILGNYTYFGTSTAELPPSAWGAWVAVLVCGVLGGLLGGSFSALLVLGSRYLAPFARKHPLYLALGCGVLISLLGWLSHGETFGTGYDQAKILVTGTEATAQGDYFLYKYAATVVSYLSGIPGGIFAPSLSVGAGMGADLAHWLPAPFAAVIMLSMVGYFTGVVQTPITALIIVMEMTDNSSMLMPLMATALIAKGVSRFVCPTPIYEALAENYLHPVKVSKETEQSPPDKVSN
ncbi:MAG: chloride channel protein [Gammaproteobacteria bacterium]|nr:chloride channel protein [Gammaproteobacteria bacterium]